MPAVAKPQPSQPQLDPCLALESSGHHVMVLEGFSLMFIVYWQQISLPAHPSHSSPHLPSLSINLVVRLPPGLSLHLAKFLIPGAGRHVVQRAREGGRDANLSRSPSGIQVSTECALPLEGQQNISSPAISRKTDGSMGEVGGERRGLGAEWTGEQRRTEPPPPCCGLGEGGHGPGGVLSAVREGFGASGAGPPKPSRGGHLSAILLLCPRASEAVDFREDSMYSDPGCSLGLFLPWCKIVHA